MASIIPGNPPPVPKSQTSAPFSILRKTSNERQGNICFSHNRSVSLREIKFTFWLTSSNITAHFSSSCHWESEISKSFSKQICLTSIDLRGFCISLIIECLQEGIFSA